MDNNTILQERAQSIAGRKNMDNSTTEEIVSVVEFLLMPERYALEGNYVSEVFFLKEITTIPGTPPFVMGVINLRGRIVSVINLKSLFNLKDKGLTDLNKVIVLKSDEMEFGIASDSIVGNKSIEVNSLSSPPITLDHNGAQYIKGITPDGLILLDAIKLLTSNQIIIKQQS